MGKIGFVFSGQGDQYPGMGKSFAEQYPVAARVYDMCDRLRPGTSRQCFSGTEEELRETKNTQPCLFALELAQASVLIEKGVIPHALAGFSLGEVTAATVSGMFDPETGFRLVCKRGRLMQSQAEKVDTFMAAVVKLTPEQVQELCGDTEIYAVNFNCPGQITVSGLSSQMPEFFVRVKAAGGRAIPLKVTGAFHSPFMSEATAAFAEELETVTIRERTIPLYSNMTAKPYGGDAIALLSAQISHPVQWEQLIRNMMEDGVDAFIEIGPGRTLINMIRKINPRVRAMSVSEYLGEVEAC